MPKSDPFEDRGEHLLAFPDSTLRDIARNDCAPHNYRKLAVEILVGRKSPFARHADLLPFITELAVELDGIELNHPAPESGPGPLTSSVTTVTMFNDGPLDPPNAPLSAATVRVGNSLLNARVPEENILRDPEDTL